jgi:shikimate kinase
MTTNSVIGTAISRNITSRKGALQGCSLRVPVSIQLSQAVKPEQPQNGQVQRSEYISQRVTKHPPYYGRAERLAGNRR